ncbi:hypothetical protein CWI38_0565p0030 [Hamiltosporidium tvaerminnensis]|uniref:Uncharacterized protein n=1 Tax=Hamiltosporidium tvaerminnensis TaxID=1176355 RepID=A0A4Q9LXD3_9MICR|nr:hypothetical protein CWI38_0881p0010 [Hamiltosporidium tvaerminnensis]TBU12987.1 hypothetical protein CWI38_0565p0030 [Hamiltosporidium tvaerminnensis]
MNFTCCEDTATVLEAVAVYKYLRIVEDTRGISTPSTFEELDYVVRPVLVENKIHHFPECKKLLNLSLTKLGRGLHGNDKKTHPALLEAFLQIKYWIEEEVTKNKSEEAQHAKLYNEIGKQKLHDIEIQINRSDIFLLNKIIKKITHNEVGNILQDSLQIEYDLLNNDLDFIYEFGKSNLVNKMAAEPRKCAAMRVMPETENKTGIIPPLR